MVDEGVASLEILEKTVEVEIGTVLNGILVTKTKTKCSTLRQESLIRKKFSEEIGDVFSAEVGDVTDDPLRNDIQTGRGLRRIEVEVVSERYAITYADYISVIWKYMLSRDATDLFLLCRPRA